MTISVGSTESICIKYTFGDDDKGRDLLKAALDMTWENMVDATLPRFFVNLSISVRFSTEWWWWVIRKEVDPGSR